MKVSEGDVVCKMADTILEDSEKLGTYWCNGCLKVSECEWEHPRYCIINFFKEECLKDKKGKYGNGLS